MGEKRKAYRPRFLSTELDSIQALLDNGSLYRSLAREHQTNEVTLRNIMSQHRSNKRGTMPDVKEALWRETKARLEKGHAPARIAREQGRTDVAVVQHADRKGMTADVREKFRLSAESRRLRDRLRKKIWRKKNKEKKMAIQSDSDRE